MEKVKATYCFTRAAQTVHGMLSQNRPSTDALNALQQWVSKQAGRSYIMLEPEEDDRLFATLEWHEDDRDHAASDLEVVCHDLGLMRSFVR